MLIKHKKILCAIAVAGVLAAGSVGMNNSNKADLRELINTSTQDASAYTPLTYQSYSESLDAAIEISDDFFANKEEIDDAYSSLRDGLFQLQLIPDKSTLQESYDIAVGIDQSAYIPLTIQPLQEAIAFAQNVLDNINAVETDVEEAASQIESAISNLIARPDKTELSSLLDEAQAIDESIYLPTTYQYVRQAISLASEVMENQNAVVEEVEKAVLQLRQGLDGLVEKPDKSTLKLLIEQAEAFPEEKYTTVSYAALQDTRANVNAVFLDDNATPDDVSTAEAKLSEAINSLVATTKGIFRIDVRFSLESNNHVGNSWSYGAFYNNTDIDFEEVTLSYGSNISIYCEVIENDKVPDVGTGYIYLSMEDGAQKSITISVYENRGRYSGNRSVWIVIASATLIERI